MRAGKNQTRVGEAGVAAIEFAIVFPVLLLLFFGMINLTSYVSMLRKSSSAAELVADLVTRNNAKIAQSALDDYITGAKLLFLPAAASGVSVEVYNYYLDKGVTKTRWKQPAAATAGCAAPDPASTEIAALLPGGDVIIAVVCIPGYGMLVDFPGLPQLGAIRKTLALRPRHSTTLLLE